MSERFDSIMKAYYEGDKVAEMVIEGCLNVVTDMGFARASDLGENLDYYDVRSDLDEDVDILSKIISEHFNIKGALEEHVEGVCNCSPEQMFDYEKDCGCDDCTSETTTTMNVIPFPKKEQK